MPIVELVLSVFNAVKKLVTGFPLKLTGTEQREEVEAQFVIAELHGPALKLRLFPEVFVLGMKPISLAASPGAKAPKVVLVGPGSTSTTVVEGTKKVGTVPVASVVLTAPLIHFTCPSTNAKLEPSKCREPALALVEEVAPPLRVASATRIVLAVLSTLFSFLSPMLVL